MSNFMITFRTFFMLTIMALSGNANAEASIFASSDTFMAHIKAISEKYVIVQVWSPFCEICGAEVAELNNILLTANERLKIISIVGIPIQGRKREVDAFLEHFKPNFEQWYPDKSFETSLVQHKGLPWTILFNKERTVIKDWLGKISAADIARELKN